MTRCLDRIVLMIAAAGALASATPAQKPKSKHPEPAAPAVVEGELGAKLDAAVKAHDKEAGGFAGVVMVAVKGKVLLEKGYGVFDAAKSVEMPAHALFDWASISKQFVAAAMLRLIEASRLSETERAKLKPKQLVDGLKKWPKLGLDDTISRFFPDASKDKANVTLRQLLQHTSGIEAGFKQDWKFDPFDRGSFVKLVLGLPMTSTPGAKFEYSNSGYSFVGALIEHITGMPFEAYCVDHVFRPAGMKEATMIGYGILDATKTPNGLDRIPRINRGVGFSDGNSSRHFAYGDRLNWGYRGCGGVVASLRDLLAWDRALRGDKFLSKASLEDLYRPALEKYSLGWRVSKSKDGQIVEHSGGVRGVVAQYLRLLDKDVVVALACSYEPKASPQQFSTKLAELALDGS